MANTGNSLIIYGGKNSESKGFNDLWEWKDNRWHQLDDGPVRLWDHAMVYIQHTGQLMIYGGRRFETIGDKDERTDLDEQWLYKAGQWQQLQLTSPSARSSHSMTYSSDNQRVLLFGGRKGNEIYNDTWQFDGRLWTKLAISGPPARYGHSLSYDPVSKKSYLFGGYGKDGLLNDLWVFDGTS